MKTQQELMIEVYPFYQKYIDEVSTDYMAASIECCSFLMELCLENKIETVLDLGSGFSSFCFRYLQKYYASWMVCKSVESSQEWLDKTRDFCIKNNVKENNFELWENIKPRKYDLVFVDIDSTANRPSYYKQLDQFIYNKTYVVFDDMHKKSLFSAVNQIFNRSLEEINIKEQTTDKFSRYARMFYEVNNIR